MTDTETILGDANDCESVAYALEIASIGGPYTDFQGHLYGNPRYSSDGFRDAEFRDYGLARAVRVLCNNAGAIREALSASPKGDDLDPHLPQDLRERAGFMREAGHNDDADLDERAASRLQSLKAERDALAARLKEESHEAFLGRNKVGQQKTLMLEAAEVLSQTLARAEAAEAENATLKREIAGLREAKP